MKGKEPNKNCNIMRGDSAEVGDHAIPSARLDADLYREDLRGLSLSKEQEDELLEVLWNIMSTFVDIGWGLDSVQLFSFLDEDFSGQDSGKELKLDHTDKFNQTSTQEKG